MDTLPAIRTDIEILPARLEGRDLIVVRDPLGIAQQNAALSMEVAPYLRLFDGSSTIGDLQMVMIRENGGALVFRSDAERVVAELSRLGLLQTEQYREKKERIVREFAESPERPAALSGASYPQDVAALGDLLDRVLSLAPPPPGSLAGPPCALAAPHIDLRVAERTYAAAYGGIRFAAPSAVLLLGTGHALGETRYSITEKTFSTPLGRAAADREAVARIRAAAARALAADDFAHRSEHSLEFQLLFLQRLFPMERVPIVPVLCGQMEDLFETSISPLDDPGIVSLVEAISAWLAGPPGGKLAVAGVDLSHVGPKFGDARTGRSLEAEVRAYDREILEALVAGDAAALFRAGARARNRYRICGFSALWTLLAVLPGIRGTVLDHDVWHEEPTRSAVSFAAVAFSAPHSPPPRGTGQCRGAVESEGGRRAKAGSRRESAPVDDRRPERTDLRAGKRKTGA
jgi:MEMO1 family protein